MVQCIVGLAAWAAAVFLLLSGHPIIAMVLAVAGAGFLNGVRHEVWFSLEFSADDSGGGGGDGGGD